MRRIVSAAFFILRLGKHPDDAALRTSFSTPTLSPELVFCSQSSSALRATRALQAYLGHKDIQHTVRYTELSSDRFKDFWR